MNEIYTAEWEATRSGYNTGQMSSQGMDFENFRYNVIPNIVFIIYLLNASYRPNILRSYQIQTLDEVAFIIVSEIINKSLNPLNPELNPICYLLALLGAHHFLHVGRIRVKLLTVRLLMSYIYGAPILDVSRSHTTTQHSR